MYSNDPLKVGVKTPFHPMALPLIMVNRHVHTLSCGCMFLRGWRLSRTHRAYALVTREI